MKNGKMKMAPASVIRASDSDPAILKRIRKTSEFFRKLSLKALKNWHQNRGAKRLVVNRLADINGSESLVRKVYGGRPLEPKHFPLICRPYIRARAGRFHTHSGGMWRIANHEAWFILRPAQRRPRWPSGWTEGAGRARGKWLGYGRPGWPRSRSVA